MDTSPFVPSIMNAIHKMAKEIQTYRAAGYMFYDENHHDSAKTDKKVGTEQALEQLLLEIKNGPYRKRTQDSVWYNFLPVREKYDIKVGRKWVKQLIRKICDKHELSRESIGIIAAARASMYFDGEWSSVSFEAVGKLAENGTDITEVLSEYATKYGVALVNTIGYLTEYGKGLVDTASRVGGHVCMLSPPYDLPGFHMVSKVPGLIRIGIDEETL